MLIKIIVSFIQNGAFERPLSIDLHSLRFSSYLYLTITVIKPKTRAAATNPIPKSAATIPVLRYTETVANSFPLVSAIDSSQDYLN